MNKKYLHLIIEFCIESHGPKKSFIIRKSPYINYLAFNVERGAFCFGILRIMAYKLC